MARIASNALNDEAFDEVRLLFDVPEVVTWLWPLPEKKDGPEDALEDHVAICNWEFSESSSNSNLVGLALSAAYLDLQIQQKLYYNTACKQLYDKHERYKSIKE